jgi:hypothetical protein
VNWNPNPWGFPTHLLSFPPSTTANALNHQDLVLSVPDPLKCSSTSILTFSYSLTQVVLISISSPASPLLFSTTSLLLFSSTSSSLSFQPWNQVFDLNILSSTQQFLPALAVPPRHGRPLQSQFRLSYNHPAMHPSHRKPDRVSWRRSIIACAAWFVSPLHDECGRYEDCKCEKKIVSDNEMKYICKVLEGKNLVRVFFPTMPDGLSCLGNAPQFVLNKKRKVIWNLIREWTIPELKGCDFSMRRLSASADIASLLPIVCAGLGFRNLPVRSCQSDF